MEPLTNFPNGIASFGVPVLGGGLPATSGKFIFVNYGSGSDGNNGLSTKTPVKTIPQAYSLARTNKDDVIVLMGNSTHVLTAMFTSSKNRVHFVGMDGAPLRKFGQNTKVQLGVTVLAADIATMKNTGVRNSFSNIKFINANTVAEGLYSVVEGGEYARYDHCEFYKSTDLDITGAAELVCNGDSAHFSNCTIGSNANAIAGAIIRPCVMLTKALAGVGKVSRDVLFESCQFWRWVGNTANAFVWATSATDVERLMEFRNCLFNVTKKSTAAPAVAIGGTHALTAGEIILTGSTAENGCTAFATQTGIHSCLPTYAAGGGSGVQAT